MRRKCLASNQVFFENKVLVLHTSRVAFDAVYPLIQVHPQSGPDWHRVPGCPGHLGPKKILNSTALGAPIILKNDTVQGPLQIITRPAKPKHDLEFGEK